MKKLVITVLMIFATTLSIMTVNAQSLEENFDENEHVNKVDETKIISFKEALLLNQGKWFDSNPNLAQAEEDYTQVSFDSQYKTYRKGQVADKSINEEKYALIATDSVGTDLRLEPHDTTDMNRCNNIGASNIKVRLETDSTFPSPDYIKRNNDSRKLKYLESSIDIPGENTRVDYGKILYRTASTTGGPWTSWSFKDLDEYLDSSYKTLDFSGDVKVQIVIIYEVWEKADSIFHPHKYYHVRGMYSFYAY